MGTRSVTRVFEDDEEVCTIYRHYDGYPSAMGQDLVDMLHDKVVVNGYSTSATVSRDQMLNGAGRVAAFIVTELSNDGHDPDILPQKCFDAGQEYEYHVKVPNLVWGLTAPPANGAPIVLECYSVRGGYSDQPRTLEREELPPPRSNKE